MEAISRARSVVAAAINLSASKMAAHGGSHCPCFEAPGAEKVNVRIRCMQRVEYDQTVEMTRDQWEELKVMSDETLGSDDGSALADYINHNEVCDSGGYENIEMELVDNTGEPLDPPDEYLG